MRRCCGQPVGRGGWGGWLLRRSHATEYQRVLLSESPQAGLFACNLFPYNDAIPPPSNTKKYTLAQVPTCA